LGQSDRPPDPASSEYRSAGRCEASRKVILADGGRQIELDGAYSYQRGDIYRLYRAEGGSVQANLSNPAPGIKIHAEIEMDGQSGSLQMIAPETGELQLLA
jgi:hypothetical protein